MVNPNFKTTTELVKNILINFPKTRNSDNLLYIYVLQFEAAKEGINLQDMSVLDFYRQFKSLSLPSIETVGRCRRKIVESHPELAGDGDVEAMRMLKEEEFRGYARQVIV